MFLNNNEVLTLTKTSHRKRKSSIKDATNIVTVARVRNLTLGLFAVLHDK